jgi:hypothetical protein
MAEFRNMLQVDARASEIPKTRLKELYLQLLGKGEHILRVSTPRTSPVFPMFYPISLCLSRVINESHVTVQDRTVADNFLAKLSTAEMAALMDLMSRDQDGIVKCASPSLPRLRI